MNRIFCRSITSQPNCRCAHQPMRMELTWHQRHSYFMIVQPMIRVLNVCHQDFRMIGVLMHIVVHMTRPKIAEMMYW